jgi:metal transporter CNNM
MGEEEPKGEVEYWRIPVVVGLTFMIGIFSGLNLSVMELDPEYLKLLILGPFENEEDEKNAKYAAKILPLRKRGNMLLCTILLGMTAVVSVHAIFMANLTSGFIGVVIDTFICVFFEIVPQSVFSRYALAMGANLVWLLWFFLVLTFPISFPLSCILDKLLGEDMGDVYSRK